MKINLKARMRNKTFVISSSVLIISFIYGLLSLLGVAPRVSEKQITDLVYMAVNILALLGVVVDPTTKGINDSERAMSYYTDSDEIMVSEVIE
jgi:phi LC3 family holin